jgi:hypothetical protein
MGCVDLRQACKISSARQLEVEVELEALLVTLCAALKPTVAMSTVAMVAMKRILSRQGPEGKKHGEDYGFFWLSDLNNRQ